MNRLTRFRMGLGYTQRGDTIIEVLIAIGVISLVLTAAYATTNRNSMATLDTQEQSAAVKLTEKQVELARTRSATLGSGACFATDGTSKPASDAACAVVSGGATYKIADTYAGGVFTTKVTWSGVMGDDKNVTMVYNPIQ